MSSTWATRRDANDGHSLRLYVKIQGIANIFQEDATDLPSTIEAISRPRSKIITSIEQSETRLNLATRRIDGGSLTIRMQDDDSGTLAALFAPRSRRRTFINADHTAGTGSIGVASNTWATSTQIFYVGGETIVAGAKGGTTAFTGCTRGAFGSEAQSHNGDSAQGEFVFDVPPSWQGRRVYLTGYFINDDGTTTSALTQALGTFMLSAAPKHLGDDTWELSCVDLIEEFGNKKIGGGIFDIALPTGTHTKTDTNGNQKLVVGAGQNFTQFAIGSAQTYVIYSSGGNFYTDVLVGTSGSNTIVLQATPPSYTIEQIRHIAYLQSDPATIAAQVITSRLGDTTNSVNDVLPGNDQTDYGGGEFRMGAGINHSDFNLDSFTNAAKQASIPWSYLIDDEAALADFLFEFCLITQSAWGVDRSGQLTAYPMIYDGSASVMTVTTSIVADGQPLTIEYAEDEIYPRLRLKSNYDLNTKQYLFTSNLYDAQLQRRYPNNEASLEIASKGIVIDSGPNPTGRPSVSQDDVHNMMRTIQVGSGRGRAYLSGIFHIPILAAEIGDIVTLLNIPVLDLEGNTSIASRLGRVVAIRPRYDDAEFDVTLELIDSIYRIAPGVPVSSTNGANLMNLATAGPETASAFPGRMFSVGDTVECWGLASSETHTVIATTDTSITLNATPVISVVFIRIGPQTTETATQNADGYRGTDWLYQMPDDETTVAPLAATRWE